MGKEGETKEREGKRILSGSGKIEKASLSALLPSLGL